jgi:rhamnulose-1-phosphate aldolase
MMKGIIKSNGALLKLIKDISQVAGMFWDRGWAERNAGNISINITELISDVDLPDLNTYPLIDLALEYPELKGFFFIITGTGKRMRELARKPYAKAKNILSKVA